MMNNVSIVVLCTEVTYKGYFVIQYQRKKQNEALDLWSLPPFSDLYFIPELATTIFILFSWICLICFVALTYKLTRGGD